MAIAQATDVEFRSMLTLTYPRQFPKDGHIVKKDLNALLQKVRRNIEGEYLWFLEFQTRGAPHIHLLLTGKDISPRKRTDYGFFWAGRIAQSDWFVGRFHDEAAYQKDVMNCLKVACHPESWQLLENSESSKRYLMSRSFL